MDPITFNATVLSLLHPLCDVFLCTHALGGRVNVLYLD